MNINGFSCNWQYAVLYNLIQLVCKAEANKLWETLCSKYKIILEIRLRRQINSKQCHEYLIQNRLLIRKLREFLNYHYLTLDNDHNYVPLNNRILPQQIIKISFIFFKSRFQDIKAKNMERYLNRLL